MLVCVLVANSQTMVIKLKAEVIMDQMTREIKFVTLISKDHEHMLQNSVNLVSQVHKIRHK
jgi:hypothetical protein